MRTGLLVAAVGCIAGGLFAWAGPLGASGGVHASDVIGALSENSPATVPDGLSQAHAFGSVDFAKARVLGSHLGQFDETLYVAPGRDGRNACYFLHPGSESEGAATGYCHPLDGVIPPIAKDRYSIMTPESLEADGEYDSQLFGVVFDDVVGARLQVNGSWRDVPIIDGNGVYVDLPHTRLESLQRFEVTLQDGSVQGRDFLPRDLEARERAIAKDVATLNAKRAQASNG